MKQLLAILVAAAVGIVALVAPERIREYIYAAACLTAAFACLLSGAKRALRGDIINDEFLAVIICAAAWILGASRWSVLSALLVIRTLHLASDLTAKYFDSGPTHLLSLVPEKAIAPGTVFSVRPGERIGADGYVRDGETMVSTLMLNGSTTTRPIRRGDKVAAGFTNLSATIVVEAQAGSGDSLAARMMKWINANSTGGKAERAARALTLVLPLALIVIGAAFAFLHYATADFTVDKAQIVPGILRVLPLLLVCSSSALLAAIPRVYKAAITGATKLGILFREPAVFDKLVNIKSAFIEWEGTITTGELIVSSIEPEPGVTEPALLMMSVYALSVPGGLEYEALRRDYPEALDRSVISDFREEADGITVTIRDVPIVVGKAGFMDLLGIATGDDSGERNALYIAVNGRFAGRIVFAEQFREGAAASVLRMRDLYGIKKVSFFANNAFNSAGDWIRANGRAGKLYTGNSKAEKLQVLTTDRGPVLYAGNVPESGDIASRITDKHAVYLRVSAPTADLGFNVDTPDVTLFSDSALRLSDMFRIARLVRRRNRLTFAVTLIMKAIAVILVLTHGLPLWTAALIDGAGKIAAIALSSHLTVSDDEVSIATSI
jgi:Cd2+/Zn2+-exporting ATPase